MRYILSHMVEYYHILLYNLQFVFIKNKKSIFQLLTIIIYNNEGFGFTKSPHLNIRTVCHFIISLI